MTNNGQQKETASDKLWLFTKVILFLAITMFALVAAVVFAVWAGAMAYMTTENRGIGLVVGLSAYVAGCAGRDWLHMKIVPWLFSPGDVLSMDKTIRGK